MGSAPTGMAHCAAVGEASCETTADGVTLGRIAAETVAIWLVGAAGVAAQLWGHGPDGRSGAALVGMAGAIAAVVLTMAPLQIVGRLLAVGAVALAAEWLTVPLVGRAPAIAVVAGVCVATFAISSRQRCRSSIAIALLAVWALAWSIGAIAIAVGAIAAAGAVLALSSRRGLRSPSTAAPTDPPADVQRADRSDAIVTAALVLGVGLVTAPIFWRLSVDREVYVRGINDVTSGITRLDAFEFWPPRITVAHPGWWVIVRLLRMATGTAVAITVVGAAASGAAAAVLYRWGRSRWDDRPQLRVPSAITLALCWLLLESPATLVPRSDDVWGRYPFAGVFPRGTGFWSLHQWGVPTIVLSMPFVFALFVMVLRAVGHDDATGSTGTPPTAATATSSRRFRLGLAALTVLTTLIQPATTLALAPAVVVVMLGTGRWRDREAVRSALWFVVPGALVCLGQVVFLSSNVSEYEQATWLWEPFWLWHHFGLDRVACWLAFLVIAAGLWVGGRRYLTDRSVLLSLTGLIISIWPMFLLRQTTVAPVPDADLSIPPVMAMILLTVSTYRFILIELQCRRAAPGTTGAGVPPWLPFVTLLFMVMLGAGVTDLLSATGVLPES